MGTLAAGFFGLLFAVGLAWLVVDGFRKKEIIRFWGRANTPEYRLADQPVRYVLTMVSWIVFAIPFSAGGIALAVRVPLVMWTIPIGIVGPLIAAGLVYARRGVLARPVDIENVLDRAFRGHRDEAQSALAGVGDGPAKRTLEAVVSASGGAATADYRSPGVAPSVTLVAAFDTAASREIARTNRHAAPLLGVLAPLAFLAVPPRRSDVTGVIVSIVLCVLAVGLAVWVRHRALANLRFVASRVAARASAA